MTVSVNLPKRSANVVERERRITACANSIGFFGHAVAENNMGMKALIGAASSFGVPGFAAHRQCGVASLVPGAWAAHRAADDPDEYRVVPGAERAVPAVDFVLARIQPTYVSLSTGSRTPILIVCFSNVCP
jgi:hypothetical protein